MREVSWVQTLWSHAAFTWLLQNFILAASTFSSQQHEISSNAPHLQKCLVLWRNKILPGEWCSQVHTSYTSFSQHCPLFRFWDLRGMRLRCQVMVDKLFRRRLQSWPGLATNKAWEGSTHRKVFIIIRPAESCIVGQAIPEVMTRHWFCPILALQDSIAKCLENEIMAAFDSWSNVNVRSHVKLIVRVL